MKHLYIVTIDIVGEESVYFTEMTIQEAENMRLLIRQAGQKFSVVPIKQAAGFNRYGVLMKDFQEFVDARHR